MNPQNELKRTIDAIIATDKKAREATEKVRENAANADNNISARVKAVHDEYMSRALKRVDIIQNAEREYADGEWSRTEKKYTAASEELDRLYAEKGDEWIESLVRNVIDAD